MIANVSLKLLEFCFLGDTMEFWETRIFWSWKSRFCRCLAFGLEIYSPLYIVQYLQHDRFCVKMVRTLGTHKNALRWALFLSFPNSVEYFFILWFLFFLFFPLLRNSLGVSVAACSFVSDCWKVSCMEDECILLYLALSEFLQNFLECTFEPTFLNHSK